MCLSSENVVVLLDREGDIGFIVISKGYGIFEDAVANIQGVLLDKQVSILIKQGTSLIIQGVA